MPPGAGGELARARPTATSVTVSDPADGEPKADIPATVTGTVQSGPNHRELKDDSRRLRFRGSSWPGRDWLGPTPAAAAAAAAATLTRTAVQGRPVSAAVGTRQRPSVRPSH